MSDTLSSKAVACTAHHMMLQNPEARLTKIQWVDYLRLVREWCEVQEIDGVRYYWHTGYSPESDTTGRLH